MGPQPVPKNTGAASKHRRAERMRGSVQHRTLLVNGARPLGYSEPQIASAPHVKPKRGTPLESGSKSTDSTSSYARPG